VKPSVTVQATTIPRMSLAFRATGLEVTALMRIAMVFGSSLMICTKPASFDRHRERVHWCSPWNKVPSKPLAVSFHHALCGRSLLAALPRDSTPDGDARPSGYAAVAPR